LIEDQAFEVIKKQFLSELTDSEKYAFQIITDLNSGITYRELSKRYNISSSTLKSLAKRLRDKAKIILNNVFEK
jgi:Mor family transcriptional regulator